MPAQKVKMKLCRKNVKADKRGIGGEEGGATRGKRRGRGKMSAFAGFIICPLNPRSFPLVNLLLMLRKAVCGRAHGMRPYNILGIRFRYLRNAGAAFPTIIQANISAIFGTSRDGAGVRRTTLSLAEAPTEPTGENVPYDVYVIIPLFGAWSDGLTCRDGCGIIVGKQWRR